jgi:hypothetical protein
MLHRGRRQAAEHQRHASAGLHRWLRPPVGQPEHLGHLATRAGAEVAVPQHCDVGEIDPAMVSQRVHGRHPFGECGRPARQVERRPLGGRHRGSTDSGGLTRPNAIAVNLEARARVRLATRRRQQHLGRRGGRPAGRSQQLGGGVPGDHTTSPDQHPRRARPQLEIVLEVRGGIDVGKELLEPGPAQHPAGQ